MTESSISSEVALRIGLAAERLGGVEVSELLDALLSELGEPLDEQALSRLTARQLQRALTGECSGEGEPGTASAAANDEELNALKPVVKILWGEAVEDDSAPKLQPYQPGDMPHSVRVAVASNDGEQLDGHFGSCARYLVYQVSPSEIRLVAARSAALADRSNDKNAFRVGLISDCRILYVVHIGGPAMAKVIKNDIHLVQARDGGAAREVLAKLQAVLTGAPPPWLRKALDRGDDASSTPV